MKIGSIALIIFVAVVMTSVASKQAHAGDEPFIGEIMWTAISFCPRGWAAADGQLLPVAQNEALFSLLGTIYGGDGRTTFGLPDLRGRVPIHVGQGSGLSDHTQGNKGGQEQVSLNANQMPAHSHILQASSNATTNDPGGSIPGRSKQKIYDTPGRTTVSMAASAVTTSGNGQAHENRPPYLTIRACVALTGLYPSRN